MKGMIKHRNQVKKFKYDGLTDRSLCFNCRSKSFNDFDKAFSLMK